MKNTNIYNFLGQVALNYRVSLDNLIKILGDKPTNDNKINLYNNIIASADNNYDLIKAYKYLFNYETINEKPELVALSYSKAKIFLSRYMKAKNSEDIEATKRIANELNFIDQKFLKLKKSGKESKEYTDDDFIMVCKYRIKYAISRDGMCKYLGIGRKFLEYRESRIIDKNLKEKIDTIINYYGDMIYSNPDMRRK